MTARCVECLRDAERHDLEPVTSDERWPRFGPSSRRVGLIACVALPLVAHGEHIGVLNLYAWPAVGFAGWDRRQCGTFARRASNLLASARAYERTQALVATLEARLASIPALNRPWHSRGMIPAVAGSYPIFFRNGVRFRRNSLFGLAPAGSLCA